MATAVPDANEDPSLQSPALESIDPSPALAEEICTSPRGCCSQSRCSMENGIDPPVPGGGAKKKKKKKKKGGASKDETDSAGHPADGATDATTASQNTAIMRQIQKAMAQIAVSERPVRSEEEARKKTYEFWETQPVPKLDEEIDENVNEAVEPDKDNVRQEPYSLPTGFVWDTLNLQDPGELKELYILLNENYVEDDDNMFRFDYSAEFLLWALRPPGWQKSWHCGVRVASNKKLVGFISAIPAHIRIYGQVVKMVEINFLCVHKKLRAKRVAPVLIREITRRVNLEGIFQAVYTAGVVLPKPVGSCRYWHRSLNPRKLIEVKFSHLRKNMTMQRTIKFYRLPEQPKHSSLIPLTPADVKSSHALMSKYLEQFQLAPVFTEEEFAHWFLPREGVVTSHINKDASTGEVTDMISYYTLPSTIVDHPRYKALKAAYSFYNVATKCDLTELMNDALVLARNEEFDVFNALNLMENEQFLEKLKFGIGDGNLNYYLYNWKCPAITAQQIGLVLQ